MLFYEKIDILLLDKEISLKKLNENIHINSLKMSLLRHNLISPNRNDITKLVNYSGYSTEFWLNQSKEDKAYKARNYTVLGIISFTILLITYLLVGLFAFEDYSTFNYDLRGVIPRDYQVECSNLNLSVRYDYATVVGAVEDAREYVIPEYYEYVYNKRTYYIPITNVELKEFGNKTVYISSLVSDISIERELYWEWSNMHQAEERLVDLPYNIIIDNNNPYYRVENRSILDLRNGYTILTLDGCDYSKLEYLGYNALYNIDVDVLDLSSVKYVDSYAFAHCNVNTIKFGINLTELDYHSITHSIVNKIFIPVNVHYIYVDALYSCNDISYIYYGGTKSQFFEVSNIKPEEILNFYFPNLYFYSEEQPVNSLHQWHYDKSGNAVLW